MSRGMTSRLLSLPSALGLAAGIAFAQPQHVEHTLWPAHIEESPLISDLRLGGDLRDGVSQLEASFSRPSVAYTIEGNAVPAETPRFEGFAVAQRYQWIPAQSTPPQIGPITIAGGELFATDRVGNIYASSNGETFVVRGWVPYGIQSSASAHGTPEGALLVATGTGYEDYNIRFVWRSEDGGQTFTNVLAPRVGTPAQWNWATLGETLYVSEYGKKTLDGDGNARQIYRSDDDGRTWQVVYDPPPRADTHCHKLLADPWTGCVFQCYGDSDEEIIMSCDGGESWEQVHDSFQPTAAVARQEGLYWGQEGAGLPGVTRYDRYTGKWKHVFQPWFYEDGGDNIFTMLEHDGVIYLAFANHRQSIWASVDGEHWTFLHGPFGEYDAYGVRKLVGYYGKWIHAYFVGGGCGAPYYHGHLKFRPGHVATITGLRIEAPTNNLLGTAQASSAETGLEGWECSGQATLTWDTARSYHGDASVRVDSPNAYPAVLCPPLPCAVPVGTLLQAQIHMIGDERTLTVQLYDEESGESGNALSASPFDEWTPAHCSMVVSAPENRVRLRFGWLQGGYHPITFCIDGYQITAAQTGRTWVVGGVPRAAEVLTHAVPFESEWTDFLCFSPEFNSIEGDDRQRTIKAWVEAPDRYAQLVFDPVDQDFKLIEVLAGVPQVLCSSGPVEFQPGWVHRIALRSGAGGCNLRVRIGTAIDYVASGPPLSVEPTELWIGSSPAGDDQAPGIYALSRTFSGVLLDEAVERELEYLPPVGSCPAYFDGDDDVHQPDLG
jgi:hypothetical protein